MRLTLELESYQLPAGVAEVAHVEEKGSRRRRASGSCTEEPGNYAGDDEEAVRTPGEIRVSTREIRRAKYETAGPAVHLLELRKTGVTAYFILPNINIRGDKMCEYFLSGRIVYFNLP